MLNRFSVKNFYSKTPFVWAKKYSLEHKAPEQWFGSAQ